MAKKLLILFIVIFAIAVFTAIAMFIAPYMISIIGKVLYDKWHILSYEDDAMLVYNWLLGFIALILTIVTLILFINKRSRIYALLPFPHVIVLIIAIIYIGNSIRYLGDGFTMVKRPFSSYWNCINSKGEVILSSFDWLSKKIHNDAVVFTDGYNVYDENGDCILHKPHDDKYLNMYSDFYYTTKDYNNGGVRVRFFDQFGEYVVTREYGLGGYYPEKESSELLSEYIEEVDEKPNGIKVFKSN